MVCTLPSLKRVFNVAVASTLLIATSPLLALGAGLSALEHRKNPFIHQVRVGYKNKPFRIYKLQTMQNLYDDNGYLLPANQRTSLAGKILRKSKIDELPQLYNIIKGDMNLVGPRPLLTSMKNSNNKVRHSVRPGLTSLFEIQSPSLRTEANRIITDEVYIASQSLVGDLEIICQTPWAIAKNLFGSHFNPDGQLLYKPHSSRSESSDGPQPSC